MPSERATVAVVAIVGLVLVTNPLWLFPNAGESTYTYERSEVTVENGTLTYDGLDHPEFHHPNDLQAVGCQDHDLGSERACAFDQHLVDNPPVTVTRRLRVGYSQPDFVELEGDYYRRVHRRNGSNVTHDVTSVPPRSVLREAATDVSDYPDPERDEVPVEYYVAVTGETVTAQERLDREDLGKLYRQNGTYYTVVATDTGSHQPLPGFTRYEQLRIGLGAIGVLLLLTAGLLEARRRRE